TIHKSAAARITSNPLRMFKRLRPLFPYLKKYRRGLIFGSISVLLTNAIYVQFPQVIQRATNDLNTYSAGKLSADSLRHELTVCALLLMVVFLVKGVFQF